MRSRQNCYMPTELRHYMSKPIKALRKARDLYVKKLEECAAKLSCCGPFCTAASVVPHHSYLQRSFSNSKLKNRGGFWVAHVKGGSKETSSSAPAGPSLEPESPQDEGQKTDHVNMRRHNSSGLGYLGRIDEDKPYCFEEDFMHFRSRSLGIALITNLGFLDV